MRKSTLIVPTLRLTSIRSANKLRKSVTFNLQNEAPTVSDRVENTKKKNSETDRSSNSLEKSPEKTRQSKRKIDDWLSRIDAIHYKATSMIQALNVSKQKK